VRFLPAFHPFRLLCVSYAGSNEASVPRAGRLSSMVAGLASDFSLPAYPGSSEVARGDLAGDAGLDGSGEGVAMRAISTSKCALG